MMSARIWLKAEDMPTCVTGLRRTGGNAVAANERLIDAKVETQQVLTEDGQTEHNEGKADQPGERADRPESEAE